MSKQKISESQLRSSTARLRDYIAIVEGEQQNETAATAGQAVGNAAGTVAGLASALPRAGIEAGQAVANKAGQWWDQAKQGVSNFAQGVAQGAQQGWAATDPAKMVGGGQAAAKTGTTTGAKPDPAVMARQKELIAAGAKIKADGIMGPATKAAEAQFGGQAAVMAANAKDAAAGQTPAAAPAGTTTPTPAVPGQQAGGAVVDTRGGIQGQNEMEESVTFRNDELSRLVSLVQHR